MSSRMTTSNSRPYSLLVALYHSPSTRSDTQASQIPPRLHRRARPHGHLNDIRNITHNMVNIEEAVAQVNAQVAVFAIFRQQAPNNFQVITANKSYEPMPHSIISHVVLCAILLQWLCVHYRLVRVAIGVMTNRVPCYGEI